nr:transposase [Methylomonas albis]
MTSTAMQYRRNYTEGGSYFFTVNLAERKRRLLVEHIDILRETIRIVRSHYPFQIDAMVVMPDHLHAIFTLPPDDADYPTRWMLIKAGFSRSIPKTERINASRQSKG